MPCSIEPSQTRLTTVTERVWFLRQARAMRCSSLAGFHGRSTLITALATWRLSPTLPLSVDRNSRHAGSFLNRVISARRRCCGTEPVCQAVSIPISPASSRTSSSMRSHSENTITLRPGSSNRSPSTRSSSSSFGLTRQLGSRIAGVSHTMRMQASSICRRSNSFGNSGRRCAMAIRRAACDL